MLDRPQQPSGLSPIPDSASESATSNVPTPHTPVQALSYFSHTPSDSKSVSPEAAFDFGAALAVAATLWATTIVAFHGLLPVPTIATVIVGVGIFLIVAFTHAIVHRQLRTLVGFFLFPLAIVLLLLLVGGIVSALVFIIRAAM